MRVGYHPFLEYTLLSSVAPFVILDLRGEPVTGKGFGADVGMIPVGKVDGGPITDIVHMTVLGIKVAMIRCRPIKLCATQNERTIAHDPIELDLR